MHLHVHTFAFWFIILNSVQQFEDNCISKISKAWISDVALSLIEEFTESKCESSGVARFMALDGESSRCKAVLNWVKEWWWFLCWRPPCVRLDQALAPWGESCYLSNAPKCAACGMPVVGSVARVGESAFHPDCLVCSSCHLAFTWQPYSCSFWFYCDHVNHVSEMNMMLYYDYDGDDVHLESRSAFVTDWRIPGVLWCENRNGSFSLS